MKKIIKLFYRCFHTGQFGEVCFLKLAKSNFSFKPDSSAPSFKYIILQVLLSLLKIHSSVYTLAQTLCPVHS